jgi:hypothetical protein
MFDPRNNLANEVSAQLLTHFGDKVFNTIVPRNVRLAEAPSFGKPALLHDQELPPGAIAYLALAGEMIRRNERRTPARPPRLIRYHRGHDAKEAQSRARPRRLARSKDRCCLGRDRCADLPGDELTRLPLDLLQRGR